MESALTFLERCGVDGPSSALKAARLGPYASVAHLAALPNNVVYFSGQENITKIFISARNQAQRHCKYCLDFCDGRHGFFKQHTPSVVGGARAREGTVIFSITWLCYPTVRSKHIF